MNKKNNIIMAVSIMVVLMFIMMSFSMIRLNSENNHNLNERPEISNTVDKQKIKNLGPYGHYYWGLGNPVGSTYLWTPIILVNSPYGGSASATSSQSFKVKYAMAGFSSCTQTTQTSRLSHIKNGAAEGLFGLDQWTVYPIVLKYSPTGGPCPGPKPANYVAEITNTKYNGINCMSTKNLLPSGSKSDVNELTHFSKSGFNSVIFHNGFNNNTWSKNSADIAFHPSGSGCFSFTTLYKNEESISFSINTVFSGTTYIVSGALSLIASTGTWNWGTFSYHYYSFTYNFPNNIGGKYEMEALDTGSSHDMAYAFKWLK